MFHVEHLCSEVSKEAENALDIVTSLLEDKKSSPWYMYWVTVNYVINLG
jgi:hypothetical protein